MNDYGGSSSRSRPILKSPNPHLNDDPKTIKKKYEQAKEALKIQRKNNDILEGNVKTLKEQAIKQQRELCKKDEQIENVLPEFQDASVAKQ